MMLVIRAAKDIAVDVLICTHLITYTYEIIYIIIIITFIDNCRDQI